MDLARLRTNWANLGERDPLWAILGSKQSEGVAWDLEAFLRTGVEFVGFVERHLQALGVDIHPGRAFDFGCGYGRLSQGLARHFEQVVGIDIAPSMIAGARKIDRSGGKCRFEVNDQPDLRRFESASFDFVLTTLVLQHMRPDYALGYVAEFLRILRPGGVAFFQAASRPRNLGLTPPSPASPAQEDEDLARLRGTIAVHPGRLAVLRAEWQHFVVEVRNHGDRPWRAGDGPCKVQVAARWHAGDGVVGEPGRLHDLPGDVAPGGVARMLVPLQAPDQPMQALLHFHIVVGGVWVELFDLPPARVLVQIHDCDPELLWRNQAVGAPPPFDAPSLAPGDAHPDEAYIEIHGTPIEEVVATVRVHGGAVIDVTEDVWAGPSWLSAHYTVRKL